MSQQRTYQKTISLADLDKKQRRESVRGRGRGRGGGRGGRRNYQKGGFKKSQPKKVSGGVPRSRCDYNNLENYWAPGGPAWTHFNKSMAVKQTEQRKNTVLDN